ncbi:MAG: mechanosensitive ion channel family protein [Bacteroidales bacterium]|nr:mechanosensitive ion channel family protein [Bacteroidales bacterium]
MLRFFILILFQIGIFIFTPQAHPQLMKKAGEFVKNAFDSSPGDSVVNQTQTSPELKLLQDSLRMKELELKLHEMQLNEVALKNELSDALNRNTVSDSLKRAQQLVIIDSLRSVNPGVPVVVFKDTLFRIYAPMGGRSPSDRAETIVAQILKISKNRHLANDSIHTLDNDTYTDIMYADKVIMSVTEQDALWLGRTRQDVVKSYVAILSAKIDFLKNENSFWQILKRAGMFVLVIVLQYLIFKLINFLFRKLKREIIRFKQQKLKAIVVRDYELLNTKRLTRLILFLCNLLRIVILIFVLIITVPVLFSIFPQTENLAMKFVHYIIDPVKMVLVAIVDYIPNLFIIVVIWIGVRYAVKGVRYIAREIEHEKLKISGFYPEWAQPTFNIVRFLLYAFMIAMIYPYLPGSQSGVFQGISVFVGLIVSLGSSTVISNFIAGFVITYMRPFRPGDFIKVKDTIGNVIEKTPFITRIRTIKNEVVTIPNSFIMSSDTVNYSASAHKYGLIIHTAMTMGYDVPWRKVHKLLIEAALHTEGVLEHPAPFVLETELNDNYMCYQINAYIRNADQMPQIMSDLLQNIQDYFHKADVEMIAPHYFSVRDGNGSKIPVE